jgi:hypothetical protein
VSYRLVRVGERRKRQRGERERERGEREKEERERERGEREKEEKRTQRVRIDRTSVARTLGLAKKSTL